MNKRFTKEDLEACWGYSKDYFVDVLNGTYNLEEARKDLSSLIGSSFDQRVIKTEVNNETN